VIDVVLLGVRHDGPGRFVDLDGPVDLDAVLGGRGLDLVEVFVGQFPLAVVPLLGGRRDGRPGAVPCLDRIDDVQQHERRLGELREDELAGTLGLFGAVDRDEDALDHTTLSRVGDRQASVRPGHLGYHQRGHRTFVAGVPGGRMRVRNTLARAVVFLGIVAVVAVAGWFAFLEYPASMLDVVGVLLTGLLVLVGLRVAGRVAGSLAPGYNVAEVAVEGPITRDGGGGPLANAPVGAAAEEIVEQIERADADRGAEALLVRLNTPGGEIVPSQDIRLAAEQFEGPTVAYATDVCASGGYEIAAGCDELWAREGSIVGSIGVVGSRVNVSDLADRLGVSYEQFTAGEYKDAGTPLKELEEDEREYLQGIVDDYYDQFVADVVEGREMDAEAVRETEARVYLGEQALEVGLVDELGTREDVTERIESELGEEVAVEAFEPQRGLTDRLQRGAARTAYAFGAGVASAVVDDDFSVR